MVQKDRIRLEKDFKKLILSFLIIFAVPLPVSSTIQIPIRKDCSLVKNKQIYNYYDRQEAHDFGQKIQSLIVNKDINGIYENVLIEELQNGPRKKFISNKSFEQIFPKDWVKEVSVSEIPCDSVGWRGFMISDGRIWFDKNEKYGWTIISINGVNQEYFQDEQLIGWETNKGIIPPSCFPTFGYFEKPKVDLFTKEFSIKNKRKFEHSPGKYIGKTIPLNYKITSKVSEDNVYSVATNLDECFQWNSENGFAKKKERKNDLVVVKNIIYQKNNLGNRENHDQFKSHYQVLSKLDLSTCNQLANQLSRCQESYLIRIGYHSGGSIGWLGRYYIFGIFEAKDNSKFLVPLKVFGTKNESLNFL
jgi:hypothetical protein